MKLHNDKETFIDLIQATSNYYGIDTSLIEKDYYVTLFLSSAFKKIDGLVFKGGTSLSKCYKLIERFSEDIDLTLDIEHFSQGQKRKANKSIVEICDELNFNLSNKESAISHSHANYNVYNVEYPVSFSMDILRPELKVEMVFIQKAYPYIELSADCYIEEYLKDINRTDIIKKYDLQPFNVKTQTLERTFVDKTFAICDYYLRNETLRNSRHIYDLYKLLTHINLNSNDLKKLIQNVRNDRKTNKACVSAQDRVDISSLLKEIIDKDIFKKDYLNTTNKLLINYLDYETAISSLQLIIDSHLFDLN